VLNETPIATLIARAESVYLQAEFDTARVALERTLVMARTASDSLNEARALTLLGLTAWRTADLAKARKLGEQALALKRRLHQPAELSRSYNALGLLAWNEGRLAEAAELFRQTTEAATAEGDSATSAKAANNLGLVYVEQGNLVAARAGFEEARDIAAKRADARIEGGALTNLGMLHVQLGDPASAVVALTRARARYRSISYATGEQNTLAQLATAYEALGEPRLAFAAADTALTLARLHGLRQEEAANIELAASLHLHAGDARRALALYERGRALYKEMGAAVDEGRSLRDAAEVEARLGRGDIAKAFAAAALALHVRAGARLDALRDHLLLAELASLSGAGADVANHLAAARASASALGVRPARVEVALARATIADREGNGRAALRALAEVRADLEHGGYGTEWREASLRARAFMTIGNLDSAVAAGRSAVAAIERLRARFGSRYFRSTYAADKAETYGLLVESLLTLHQEGEAFEVADAARSRALIENLGVVESDSAVRRAVRVLRDGDALLSRIDRLAARLDTLDETPVAERDEATKANGVAVLASLAEARSAYEALLVRAAEGAGDGVALLGSSGARVAEIRSALNPGEALVEYLTTPSRVITFVVTTNDVRHVGVEIPRDQIVRQARIARDLVGRRASADPAVSEMLTALHDVLIAPAERAGLLRNVHRLIVVPHAFMSYLPFSALRRGADGRYVAQDYAVLSTPSAAAFAELRRTRRAESAGPGSARSTGFAPFPDGLPATKRELRAFERAVRSAAGESGTRATEARLRVALVSDGIVHVASHGQMNPHNPMFSRIELARGGGQSAADDGRLEVHEVLGLRVGAGLVFLSGCETGTGPAWSTEFVRGEDYASLAQAFLFAGARSVVSTLWPIADDGAAEFATRFYAHLATDAPPEALAAAQREMLSVGRRSAPYSWAAYQVSGDGRGVGVAGIRTKQASRP
jgi:CHAT domain-containing protein/tetratricopeptide (TPR) repeat protein